jgi:hypothetical protein
MPQYFNQNFHDGRFETTITPVPVLRRWLKNFPFFVGDRVKFNLQIVDRASGDSTKLHLFEVFGNKTKIIAEFYPLKSLNEKYIEGNIIDVEGDIAYKIGAPKDESFAKTIFTAKVINRDSVFFQWFWLLVGAFFTFICGVLIWLLGFIEIVPFWKIWIP